MIERHWKGVTRVEEAENYIKHLKDTTFPLLSGMAGFINATILKRSVDEGIEFLIITVWESVESIKQFAGEHVELANVPPEAQEMMVEYDLYVNHYEVVGGVS